VPLLLFISCLLMIVYFSSKTTNVLKDLLDWYSELLFQVINLNNLRYTLVLILKLAFKIV